MATATTAAAPTRTGVGAPLDGVIFERAKVAPWPVPGSLTDAIAMGQRCGLKLAKIGLIIARSFSWAELDGLLLRSMAGSDAAAGGGDGQPRRGFSGLSWLLRAGCRRFAAFPASPSGPTRFPINMEGLFISSRGVRRRFRFTSVHERILVGLTGEVLLGHG